MKQYIGVTTRCYQCEHQIMTLEELVHADWKKLKKEWKSIHIHHTGTFVEFSRWKKKRKWPIILLEGGKKMKFRKKLWRGDDEFRNTGMTRDEVSVKMWELIIESFDDCSLPISYILGTNRDEEMEERKKK